MVGISAEESVEGMVETVQTGGQHILVKLHGVDTRSSAEKIIGSMIFVDENEVEQPQQGSYFIHDVIGCSVYLPDGTERGIVEDVYRSPAQDLWAIRYNGKLSMIPAVKEIVKVVDIQKKKIIIAMIEGLIEE
jgi:16S rRNA processing protein RimM